MVGKSCVRSLALACALLGASSLTDGDARAQYSAVFLLPSLSVEKAPYKALHDRQSGELTSYQDHASPLVREWYAHLKSLSDASDEAKLAAIFAKTHELVRYRPERNDVWSTAAETIARGYGDCDDFANLYIIAAALTGFDMARAWMAIGYAHEPGRPPQAHAVAVIGTKDGQQYVLDNLNSEIVPDDRHVAFRPVYSINIDDQRSYFLVNSSFVGGL